MITLEGTSSLFWHIWTGVSALQMGSHNTFINYAFSDSFIIEQILNINILINVLIN